MKADKTNPPGLAAWLIRRMFPDGGGSSVLGDMTETCRSIAAEGGRFRAGLWFWWQTLKAVPPYANERLFWRLYMFKNYLLITFRNLKKNSTYSLLNIFGLAVGMAAFILIALYVQFERSFDQYHAKAGRIHRVVREERAFTPPPLGPELSAKIPEVEAVARLIPASAMIARGQESFLEENFYWAEPQTFQIFSIPFVHGDPDTALNDPSSIVLSKSSAARYFGSEDPMGKRLTVNEGSEFTVTGVFEDIPANTHFSMDVLVPFDTYYKITNNDVTSWMSNHCYTYFLMREGVDPRAVENKIPTVIEAPLMKAFGVEEPYPRVYFTQPVTEIHLFSHRQQEIQVNNDIKTIILFASIAVLILLIACVNYMNLSTARSLRRAREVGLRKVVGAKKGQLVTQFLGESVMMAALSMALSMVMVRLALPFFNSLVERPLTFNPVRNPELFLGLAAVTLVVGLLAGSYPAVLMSRFRPASVLGGSFSRSRGGRGLRNVLVLGQFSITIILLVCAQAVQGQLRFIQKRDVGYSKDQIITVPVRGRTLRRDIEAIKTELLSSPLINGVSTSACLPNDIDTFTSRDWTGKNPREPITIFYNTADYDFIDLFGIEIVEGRNFSRDFPSDESGAILVNETAVKAAEWDRAIGKEFEHVTGQTGHIVGVMKDFHLRSLHSPIEPLYIYWDQSRFSHLAVKINTADIPAAVAHIEGVVKKFSPQYPFSYSFFDEVFEEAYFTEQRLVKIFSTFAALAILIACLGLFGLAAYAAEQRTREIGIRKVLGATGSKIFGLLSREFVRWVLLANVIAWPLAWLAMNRWLQNFAYRARIGVEVFLISGAAALMIAYMTVSWQSLRSARSDPSAALKHE